MQQCATRALTLTNFKNKNIFEILEQYPTQKTSGKKFSWSNTSVLVQNGIGQFCLAQQCATRVLALTNFKIKTIFEILEQNPSQKTSGKKFSWSNTSVLVQNGIGQFCLAQQCATRVLALTNFKIKTIFEILEKNPSQKTSGKKFSTSYAFLFVYSEIS